MKEQSQFEKPLKSFIPSIGVMVYKKDFDFYLQVHEIIQNDNKFTWGEGKPFQRDQLQELALFLKNETLSTLQLKGMLPENVLYYQPSFNGNKFLWYIPAGEHYLNFGASLKMKSGKCKMPGLIFAVNDKSLSVFAFKGKKKPTVKTELFQAPFYNIYEDGNVCMGTTRESKKQNYLHEEIDRWHRRFFGSKFTDAHGDPERLTKGHTMKSLYKTILSGKPFPEAAIAKAEYKTLGNFIKDFSERNKNDD